jgi:competence protein ComEC
MAFSFAFFAGVLLLLALPELPTAWIALPLVIAALLPLMLPRRFPGSIALCGLSVGFLYAGLHAYEYLHERWPAARAEDRVIAEVIVDTIPVARDAAWSFDGIVTIEAPKPMAQPLRVRLISRDPEVRPHAGERWRLLLTLRPPRARVNPGAADLERVLFHDRVHALGSVISSRINHRIDDGHRPLAALRERIAQHIDERVADRDAAALISALAVGVTGGMSREQWRVFNVTGTTHLVAISGLHVTLFAVVAFAAARRLWSSALWRFVRSPREAFAAVVGFIAATAYATLAGLSVPTQRTLIMLGVWLLARSVARACAPFQSFAVALAAVLVLDPFAPLAAGFWLSFGAMGAIILVTSARFAPRHFIREAVAVQAAVTVALAPLTLASFGSLSAVGPLVNVAAIPAMSWVFVPTILLSIALAPLIPVASDAVLALAAWMHDAAWPWLAWAADLPWALVHASPPAWWYAAAAVGVVLSLLPLPRSLRAAALVWLVPLAAGGRSVPVQGAAEITVLDVGEGTSIVVQTARHTLVYDTGDVYGNDGRTAESVLVPYLRSRGVRRVDVLVVSQLTPVRSPGIAALLAEMPVTQTLVGGRAPADFNGARPCRSVGSWRWDGIVFRVLRPGASVSGTDGADVCVLLVASEGVRALLPGDIDARAERGLMRANDLAADIVVVPRHGSDSASTSDFIAAVGARWAVVSGRRTRDAPEKPALSRWRDHGATVLATVDIGAIGFRIGPLEAIEGPQGQRTRGASLQSGSLWRSSP